MFDLAMPNDKPGQCVKCKGTGRYEWGASVNGKMTHGGKCYSCRGTGKQDRRQISRNHAYNRHKIASLT